MKKTLLVLTCISLARSLSGQYWSKRFDFWNGNEDGIAVLKTNDGVLVKMNPVCNYNHFCMGVMKFDFEGNFAWKFGMLDSLFVYDSESVQIMDDTVFLNATYTGAVGDVKDFSLIKLTSEGVLADKQDYWHPGLDEQGRDMVVTDDRILVSFKYKDTLINKWRTRIRALDRNLSKQWELNLPREQASSGNVDLEATPDGGIVVAYVGYTGSHCKMTIDKYDADGNLQWATVHPSEYDDAQLVRLALHPDGGYVGRWVLDTFSLMSSEPPMVFKLDSNGKFEWQKIYMSTLRLSYNQVFATKNGDIIVCGTDRDYNFPQSTTSYGFIRRMTSKGETIWTRRISDERDKGYRWQLYDGVEMDNGDFIFTGTIADSLVPNTNIPYNVWLIRVDSMGCFAPNCETNQFLASTEMPPPSAPARVFEVFPVPFSRQVSVASILGERILPGDYRIVFYDLQGRVALDRPFQPQLLNTFDASALPPGIFSAAIFRDGVLVQTTKAVKAGGQP